MKDKEKKIIDIDSLNNDIVSSLKNNSLKFIKIDQERDILKIYKGGKKIWNKK